MSARSVLLALAFGAAGCGAGTLADRPLVLGDLHLVAEGPCARLSAASMGERRVIVYGDTGYDLHDWSAGEQLAAAQSLVEVTKDGVRRNKTLLRGLPTTSRGYVPGNLELGEDSAGNGWLLRIDTRYAPRGTGSLFVRELDPYELSPSGWARSDAETPLDLGPVARGLPDVPLSDACEDEALRFVPLAWDRAKDGSLLVAGRCQDDSHIAYADTTLVVAHAAPGSSTWEFGQPPRSNRLNGIVNLSITARSRGEAWLTAYEPFSPVNGRQSYLARWDGARWTEVDLGIDEGLMSVASDAEGRLFVAASRGLYRRDVDGLCTKLPLPPLRYTQQQPDLHIHHATVFDAGDLWVEASYRVKVRAGDHGEMTEIWASALYSNVETNAPLYCDAAEEAGNALAEVEGG